MRARVIMQNLVFIHPYPERAPQSCFPALRTLCATASIKPTVVNVEIHAASQSVSPTDSIGLRRRSTARRLALVDGRD